MKKKLLMVLGISLAACIGVSAGIVKFEVPLNKYSSGYMRGTGEGVMNVQMPSTKTVSLFQLSTAQKDKVEKAAKEYLKTKNNSSTISEYSLPDETELKGTDSFYDFNQNPVLDQGRFGTCVTFATTGLLGFSQDGNTDSYSQLYTLFEGYKDTNSIDDSGWNGLNGAMDLLNRLGTKNDSYIYLKDANNKDENEYNLMSDAARNCKLDSVTEEFYKNNIMEYYNDFIKNLANLSVEKIKVGFETIEPSENETYSDCIAGRLERGEKVIAGIAILGDENGNRIFDGYKYNKNEHCLIHDSSYKNTWNTVTQKSLGGHAIIIVSYFVNTEGKKMFLIRNSWGSDVGDDGNYFMSEDYLNTAILDAVGIFSENMTAKAQMI